MNIKKLVVAIGGASGVHLGVKFIECIPQNIELFVIVSEGAKAVAFNEVGEEIESILDRVRQSREFRIYDEDELDSGEIGRASCRERVSSPV